MKRLLSFVTRVKAQRQREGPCNVPEYRMIKHSSTCCLSFTSGEKNTEGDQDEQQSHWI